MKRCILKTVASVLVCFLVLGMASTPIGATTVMVSKDAPVMGLTSLESQVAPTRVDDEDSDVLVAPQSGPGINRYSVLLLDVEGGFTMTYEGVEIYKVETPLETVKKAALKFVEQIQSADGTNHVAIITYDSSAYLETGFSTDTNDLTSVINGIQTGSGFANINDALERADALLSQVTDENAIKNVVIFSQGVTGAGDYTSNGPYTEDDCSWIISATDIYIYQHSNASYNTARALMEKYNLYSVGLFQEFDKVPENGLSLLNFAKRFAGDLQNKGFYDVANVDDLIFAFGDIADEIAVQEVDFQFSGHLVEDDVAATCYYSDGYFLTDARHYNDHLATMSLCFELTTWSRFDEDAEWTTDETIQNTKFSNARDLLVNKLGFERFMVNDFWAAEPTKDSIGAVAASKTLPDGSVLIALGVRGGGYGQEWASNFTVGKSGEHTGFSEAKRNVLKFLDNYITSNGITGSIKLWLVGYSRAGATANMVAGEIINGYDLANDVTVADEDLFAYTFEGAQGALKSNMTKDYSSIHNVININDVVPMVAPSSWGFGRYNADEWLPSTYSDGYAQQKASMLSLYQVFRNNITDSKAWADSAYRINDYGVEYGISVDPWKFLPGGDPLFSIETYKVPTNTIMLDSTQFLFDDVIGGRTTYYYDLQAGVREIFALLNGGKLTDLLDEGITMEEFLSKFFGELTAERLLEIISPVFTLNFDSWDTRKDKVKENLEDFVKDVLGDSDLWGTVMFVEDLGDTLTDLLWRLLESVVDDALENGTASVQATVNLVVMAINGGIGQAHYPEITLAWLMSQDSYYVNTVEDADVRGYRVVHINCPVDVLVRSEDNGKVVASIISDVPYTTDGTSVDAYLNANGEKVVILPVDAGYTIEMTATGTGDVSYTINEFSLDRMDNGRIVHYDTIPVTTGDVLTGLVPAFSEEELETNIEDGSNAVYTLLDSDRDEIQPSQELTGDAAADAVYRVGVSANNQSGYVTGGGSYTMGSFASVKAYPLSGGEFLGWYYNNEKVSDDMEYRFSVMQDMELVARFAEVKKHQITFTSEIGGSVSNVPIAVPAQSQIILEAVADPGYHFSHWSTSGDGSLEDASDPNTTYTVAESDAQITANWIVCPSAHFMDVKEGDWWHQATDYVVQKGYMYGMSGTHFGPAVNMNRAQFVTVLYRMEGAPDVWNTHRFGDVPDGTFYTDAVYWALESGITTGTSDTTFSPSNQLTRTELVTFMYRYAMYKGYDAQTVENLNGYTDSDEILPFAVEAWKWAVHQGIITGMTSNTLSPMSMTNRAQAATIFLRFDGIRHARTIIWTEINAGSTYDSSGDLTGFLLQCMFNCEPHNENGFTPEISFDAEPGHKPFYVDTYINKYMYFSFLLPNDPTLEGWHSVTLHYDGTYSKVEFYLKYLGDYSHLVGTPGSTDNLGWCVSQWRVVD